MNTGGCFCGALRYETSKPLTQVTYCHCSKCRRWHGHVGAYTAVDRDGFKLTRDATLKWHAVSPAVRRGFCTECGSTVLFDEQPDAKMGLTAGSLDEPTGIKEKAHIFVGSKGDYYELGDGLPKYDTIPSRPRPDPA